MRSCDKILFDFLYPCPYAQMTIRNQVALLVAARANLRKCCYTAALGADHSAPNKTKMLQKAKSLPMAPQTLKFFSAGTDVPPIFR